MDWTIVERLAPSLAWPIVALIALPFAVLRVNALIRALDQAQNLSSGLRGLLDLDSQMIELAANIKRLREEVELIRTAQIADNKERTAEQAGPELEVAAADSQQTNELYGRLSATWREVLHALEDAYARYRMDAPDRRSVGSAAVELTDRRRRTPLAPDDAEVLAELHGLYKRYGRVKHELTEDALGVFAAKANEMVAKLDAVGSQ